MKTKILTMERLVECLSYDPDTGLFVWAKTRHAAPKGKQAGSKNVHGYMCIRIDFVSYLSHRLAVAFINGEMPSHDIEVDHINGIKDDNRAVNLRLVNRVWNMHNRRVARSDSKHGFLGVEKSKKKWLAKIQVDGKRIRLGIFDTPQEAHEVYMEAKKKIHEGWVP